MVYAPSNIEVEKEKGFNNWSIRFDLTNEHLIRCNFSLKQGYRVYVDGSEVPVDPSDGTSRFRVENVDCFFGISRLTAQPKLEIGGVKVRFRTFD
jgi:hypothetical protein